MNILVIGCGKVGCRLASYLSRIGHDVSVIDRHEESFDSLDNDFSGFTVTGVPIDQDILRKAGIEGCDALAAVTPDDNINIMVSQLAKEIFHVPKVLARIYDPTREDVFSHFGLRTICPTNLTVDAVYSMLTDRDNVQNLTFDATSLSFYTVKVPKQYNGSHVKEIEYEPHEVLLGVLHQNGRVTLVDHKSDFYIHETDKLIFSKVVD